LFAFSPALADDDNVSFAKSLQAKDYDSNLRPMPVEQWFKSVLPHGIIAVWNPNITDCGEQTGNPAIDRTRDMPMCAEIELKKNSRLVGYLFLVIGSEKKGKLKEDAGLYYGYIKKNEKEVNLKKLGDLSKINERTGR
jgi:hypothetical protein